MATRPRYPPPTSTPEHLQYARRGAEVERAFVQIVHRAVPRLELREEPGLRLTRHPIPSTFLNQASVTARPDHPDEILAAVRKWFANPSIPWRLTASEEWRDLLDGPCLDAGLRPGETHPVMVLLDRQIGPPRGPEGFRCERVRTLSELAVFDETFHPANEFPQTGFWNAEAFLREPAMQMWVGFLDDRPVATGLGVVAGDLTGVWAIATMPDVRGRGIGAEITRRIADAGRGAGARATYLWASTMGFPVYRRLGFQHARNETEWNDGPPPKTLAPGRSALSAPLEQPLRRLTENTSYGRLRHSGAPGHLASQLRGDELVGGVGVRVHDEVVADLQGGTRDMPVRDHVEGPGRQLEDDIVGLGQLRLLGREESWMR